MQFVFKRDEEGRERIYVGDVCVAHVREPYCVEWQAVSHYTGITSKMMDDAIERADEAGFWHGRAVDPVNPWDVTNGRVAINEVTVDVPVDDNAVLSVTVGGDES